MKIAIVNRHYQDAVGGSELQCHVIADTLQQLGHEVVYLVAYSDKSRYDVDYPCLPLGRPFQWAYAKALWSERPDVVYWRCCKKGLLLASLITRAFRIPMIFAVSHVENFTIYKSWSWRSFWPLDCVKKGQRVLGWLFNNMSSFANYLGYMFVDGAVSNNHDLMTRIPVKKRIRIRNCIVDSVTPFHWNRPFVLWVANLKPNKRPERYIQLAGMCQDLDVDFLMVGAVQSKQYEYVSLPSALPGNVHYLGPKSLAQVNGMLHESLFLVHTCLPEGFCGNLIQAWHYRKPTVTLTFDPEGIIAAHQLGYVSGSMEQMAVDVRRLVADDALRDVMGRRAHDLAVRWFDARTNVSTLGDFITQLLQAKRSIHLKWALPSRR